MTMTMTIHLDGARGQPGGGVVVVLGVSGVDRVPGVS